MTGVVVIGRNEGDRLARCLRSLSGAKAVVYVDSGSTDGSVELATEHGADVVLLSLDRPFTAARARNAGWRRLAEALPGLERVQFVDGDCEVAPGWLAAGDRSLDLRPDVAVVCGRRRERHPEHSVYNRLCDLEWDTPTGETGSCGGDALMRVGALRQVGGFDDSLIAGEEPELCARLRAAGWKVLRIPEEMTLHDAAMTRLAQWWRRTVRTGYGLAEVARRGAASNDRTWTRTVRSNFFWALAVPLLALAAALVSSWLGIAALAGYPALALRIDRHRRRRGDSPADARLYAAFNALAKFPMALGQARYYRNHLLGRTQALIEYKGAAPPGRVRAAYLVNQYPHVSHSFIRREIAGVEAAGVGVLRVSVRRPGVKLVDLGDQAEERLTRVLLDAGAAMLAAALLQAALGRPLRLLGAARAAWRLGGRSGKRRRALVYLAEACLLRRWLDAGGVTHLHAHFGTNPADVALLCRALGGPPFSFTVHGPEEFDRPEAISLCEKVAAAEFVVAVSSFGRSQLYRWCRLADWPKVRVVRCGVDARFLSDCPPPPATVPRLVCVGRLAEQKGQLLLIDAASRLAAGGAEFELVLAGDGPMRGEVEAAIKAHGLGGRVRVTGWLGGDSVRAELVAARALVLPSFAEGLPVVIMESLALGRPVVTTTVAGIPELVRDGVSGWLVPPGDPEALAGAMRRALEAGPDRLAEMGRAGAGAVRAMHDAGVEGARLAALVTASARGQL